MAEITTFYKYIKDYDIKIPIIQRDYAQGREENEKVNNVRKNLLEAFKNALDNTTTLDLNFVYGTVEKNSNRKVFIPVDGQQRLTTLYLLHYYLFVVSDNEKEIKDFSFYYETRASAAEFFSWLGTIPENLIKVLKNSADKADIKKEIFEMPEYQSSWKNDPTVASAVTMICDIKSVFGVDKDKAADYAEKLCSVECPIKFSVIGETNENAKINADKAYIRMNARGKSLNDFENLRAVVDRIDSNLDKNSNPENKVKVIDHYDQKYINYVFEKCRKDQPNLEITAITDRINKKSFAAFKNIFFIMSSAAGFTECKDSSNYIIRLNGYSKNISDNNAKREMQIYLNALDTYFAFSCRGRDGSMRDNRIFNEECTDIWRMKEEAAEVIYCYFYKKTHNEIPTESDVTKFLYVLKNLDFCRWTNYFNNIYQFCETAALEKDIYNCFMSEEKINKFYKIDAGISDIRVRIKEQKIKIGIIRDNKLDDFYFKSYEKNSESYEETIPHKKLQFFLYVAGYWNNDNCSFEKLKNALENATEWEFFDDASNQLEFRKRYAVTAYLNDNNELLTADEINKQTENSHIWNLDYCFWNDTEEDDNSFADKCMLAKKAFEIDNIIIQQENKLTESEYVNCWLRYAVKFYKYNQGELLKNWLCYNDDRQTVCLKDNNRNRNFWLYLFTLINSEDKDNFKWGDEEYSETDKDKTKNIWAKSQFAVIYENIKKLDPDEVKRKYPDFDSSRAFNITLAAENIQKFSGNNADDNDVIFIVKDNTQYFRYSYQKENPSVLVEEEFDVADALDNMKKQTNAAKQEINEIFNDSAKYLAFYEQYRRQITSEIYNYIRYNRKTRTWIKRIEAKDSLDRKNSYEKELDSLPVKETE